MRSGPTTHVVHLAVSLVVLAGCASAADKSAYEAQSPASGAYLSAPPSEPARGGYPPPQGPRDEVSADRVRVDTAATGGSPGHVRFSASEERDEGARKAQTSPEPAPPPPPSQPQASPAGAAGKSEKPDATAEPAPSRDLVIYTARFTMAVYQVEQGLAAVEKIARDNGGFLGQKKDREITVRVPRGRFEATLAAVDGIGDVLHREIQAQDVTDEHVDLEIRIKNARAMQKRLTDLLSRATVKDALEIEKELHRVTQELELLEGRMKVLKDKVALSTITVAFEPRGATIQTARVRLPFPWLAALNLPSLLSLSEER